MILLIDNYDSFSYNLYQRLGEIGMKTAVVRNDAVTVREMRKMKPDGIVISPGPGTPGNTRYFGIGLEAIRVMGAEIPLLGVCLGHQGIAYAFGGSIVHADRVMHGKTSLVSHDGEGLFEGIDSPTVGGRYHSLVVEHESLPSSLKITAMSEHGEIMALRHAKFQIHGIQFHPESILTPSGSQMLLNFRRIVRGEL